MIKTRLLKLLHHAAKYIVYQVVWQWISLLAQVMIVSVIASLIGGAYYGDVSADNIVTGVFLIAAGIGVRFICDRMYTRAGYHASVDVKRVLREKIFEKLLRLGASYREKTASSQIVQMTTEGVEQLETYFGKYLSQFFYALLAPITLFLILMRINFRSAVILLAAVPLIPIVIMVVMIVARKLLDKYFNIYYGLGDSFLEKLQGLTTLKVYQADQEAADDMDRENERFRKVTMKVLSMQLNSTVIMDIVAYGGAAVGMVTALSELQRGNVTLVGAVMIILLGAEFFLPMRLLGSYFHIGMNGMKASDRIFAFLDLEEPELSGKEITGDGIAVEMNDVTFSYDGEKDVLQHVNLAAEPGSFISVVGVSGSGKSTIAGILVGRNRGYHGAVTINGIPLTEISEESLMQHLTLVSHDSHIFKGTVRDNLLIGKPDAAEEELLSVLSKVQLLDFVRAQGGLDMKLEESGENLSGGQKQRLALARALLHDSDAYLFDEATSNIDMESEELIMQVIRRLAKRKTVILISHRLANVVSSDRIYYLEDGQVREQGTQEELMAMSGSYAALYASQKEMEEYAAKIRNEKEAVKLRGDGDGHSTADGNHIIARHHAEGEEEEHIITIGISADDAAGVKENAPETKMSSEQKKDQTGSSGHKEAHAGMGAFAVMKRLIVLVKPLTGVMCLGITLGVAGFLCAIFLTIQAGKGAVFAVSGNDANGAALAGIMTGMLMMAFSRGILHYGEQYCNHYIAFRILAIIRHKVFAVLRRLCPAKLEGRDKGNLISLITSDIELLEVFYAHTISPIAIALIVSVIMVIFAGSIYPAAGFIAAAGYVTVGVLIPLWNGKRANPFGMRLRETFGDMSSYVLESLYGLDEIIQYHAGEKTLQEMDHRSRHLGDLQKIQNGFEASQRSVTNLAIQLFSLLMLLVMLPAYLHGSCSFSSLVMLVIAMMGSFGPVTALSNLSSSLNQTIACGERVLSLLDEVPAVEEVTGASAVDFGGAAAEDVTFAYEEGNPVLEHCTVLFPKGGIIGIHGRSGCGKSTLLKLLMRFWDVQSGCVTISDQDIRALNTANIRNLEGYVMQETWLFHDTIAKNIGVGRPGASREEIEAAAKKAAIHDFIVSLPKGYDTNIGELGDTVSGGERQRIGIARAFLHDADLILLDEPTSNLDALNEGMILHALKEEMETAGGRRTIILVSHRQSTMSIADVVYEMK